MVQKRDELSWFERMTKELENDPEYLREYIILCSDEIKCQEDKIAALEQRFNALSTKFSALVEENAALRKRREEAEREKDEWKRVAIEQAQLHADDTQKLEAENALLRKRLEPIEVAWNDRSKYTVL